MSSSAWFSRSGAMTSSSWITAGFTWLPVFERRLRKRGRRFATCRSTRQTSIQSRCLTANSKHSCAKWLREPSRPSIEQSARLSHSSVPQNVPTISAMQAMLQSDRHTLYASLDEPIMLKPKNPCPVCGAETTLAEIEAHPLHVKFEIHGYLCDRCGPIKSLVVLRSLPRQSMTVRRRAFPLVGHA